MPASKVELPVRFCWKQDCEAEPVWQARNARGGSIGIYCEEHIGAALAREDARAARARRR